MNKEHKILLYSHFDKPLFGIKKFAREEFFFSVKITKAFFAHNTVSTPIKCWLYYMHSTLQK